MLDFGAALGEEGVTRRLSVGQLEQTASTDGRKGLWLAALAQSVETGSDQDPVILELGTCLGAGAVSLMLGAGGRGQYVGLEGSPDLAALTGQRLSNTAPQVSVDIRGGPFRDTLPTLLAEQPCFDLVFLDADKKRCGEYCDLLLKRGLLAPHSLLLVDNVLWKGQVLERLDPHAVLGSSVEAKALAPPVRRSMRWRTPSANFRGSLTGWRWSVC